MSVPPRPARHLARALALCAVSLAGCRRESRPLLPFTAFVPLVVRQEVPGRIPWDTRVEVTNSGTEAATVRLHRCPADAGYSTQELLIPPGTTRRVAARVPALPCVSSMFLESGSAFTVTASVQARRGQGPPPVSVPVLSLADLARPGDGVRVGLLVTDARTQDTFTVTVPGIDEDALPFRMLLVFRDGKGRELRRLEETLWGASMLAEQPWNKYALPLDVPFDLEVRFLSARRPPRGGLWVYGIARERKTGASRFIPGRVERGGGR